MFWCISVGDTLCVHVSSRGILRACGLADMGQAQTGGAGSVVFVNRSEGVGGEGPVVCWNRWSGSRAGLASFSAFLGASLAELLTPEGEAFAEFLLEEDTEFVDLCVQNDVKEDGAFFLVGGHSVTCSTRRGCVTRDGDTVREATHDWGARMKPGDIARVRYVAATRMISVLWRGRLHELAALPAGCDVAHTYFGVKFDRGARIRVTATSAERTAVLPPGACLRERGCVGIFVWFVRVRARVFVYIHCMHTSVVVRAVATTIGVADGEHAVC